eukprot:TRINITY_DN27556_c0_g3_i1.p1 TRINITY_DN27556_c0_g3~~TRINITY_DN27556_c0_g3_i1.p1  ORF type:complete len:343 (-),score=74.06 TRINITY_DN27556_c0_g3_i1:18-1001(-)
MAAGSPAVASSPARPDLRPAPVVLSKWYEENRELFSPPICNKLMHKDQLTVMFVGGPNTRTDFHLDEGSEFFYQIRGNMELPTIQRGKRKLVKVREGQVYCLPSRVPHSPQRPEADALGLVVERRRDAATERDGLRWYVDFEKCEEVLYERYFYCDDLGRDLVPVVQAFKASEACRTGRPREGSVPAGPPAVEQDMDTEVPEPFYLKDWLDQHAEELARGAVLNLFEGHPDGEFCVRVAGGESAQLNEVCPNETFLYQLRGQATVELQGSGETIAVTEDGCFVVGAGRTYSVRRPTGSIGLVVTCDPLGNKPAAQRARAEKRQRLHE